MVPPWPFKKKTPKPKISRAKYFSKVVEYDRKTEKEKKDDQEKHLKNKKFVDAMKLLSKKDED